MVTLNAAVATAMVDVGRRPGSRCSSESATELDGHQRLHAVRAHLLERVGDLSGAAAEFHLAAAKATNIRERQFLDTEATRVARLGHATD